MKKLILVSMLYQVTDLVRTIAPELEGKTVTYIPTAGIAEEVEGMVEKETSTLESLGLTVDVLEVSTSSQEEIVDSLNRNGITIMMVTHDIHPALNDAQTILHLSHNGYFFGPKEKYFLSPMGMEFMKEAGHDHS